MKEKAALLSGPLLFGLCLLLWPGPQGQMVACLLWMLAWWITQALPIGATALLPVILFPLLGILDLRATVANYANPVIYLFLGGFILGLALEKWNLHRRIALNILKLSGEQPRRIILGAMLATFLLSMWISNTATTVMMLPIGMSLFQLLKKQGASAGFGLNLMLGIAYAANIGGMATLIGTPPNLVLAGISRDRGLPSPQFADWLLFALPLALFLFLMVYLLLTAVFHPLSREGIKGVKAQILEQLKALGKMGRAERRTLTVMTATATLWIFRAQLNQIAFLSALSDTAIAISAALALFALPSGSDKAPRLLEWRDTERLPWGILLLFGGGFALAKGMEVTQIVQSAGALLANLEYPAPWVPVVAVCALAVFLTEVMSNVALVTVFIPVAITLAPQLGLPPMALAVPLTLGASCAFMFPISTPPNAIVFSSGYFSMRQMARVGFWLNLVCVLLISFYSYLFWPV